MDSLKGQEKGQGGRRGGGWVGGGLVRGGVLDLNPQTSNPHFEALMTAPLRPFVQVMRSLSLYLWAQSHPTVNLLEERGVVRESAPPSFLRERERVIVDHANIGTV